MNPYVLVVSPEFGWGGVGVHTLKVVDFLVEERYRVRVHTTSRSKKTVKKQRGNRVPAGLQVHAVAEPIPGFEKFNPLFNLFSVFRQGEKPSLVIRPLPLFYLRTPHLRSSAPELIIVHDTLIEFLRSTTILRGQEKELSERFLSSYFGKLVLRSEKSFLSRAKKIVAVSHYTKNILSKYYKVDQEKISVIYNPVDTSLFKRRHPSEIESETGKKIGEFKGDDLLAVFVGRPSGVKNFGLLAKVVEKFHDRKGIKFVVVGKSEENGYARFYIKEMKRHGVLFTGYVENYNMPDVYSLAEFLIITSFNENMPTCLLEAMACGTIPVSTDVGGISEVVRDHENGFLVKKSDEADFCRTLGELVSFNTKTLDSISRSAQKAVRDKCERDLVKKDYLSAISEVI